jgi:hypothetical protein
MAPEAASLASAAASTAFEAASMAPKAASLASAASMALEATSMTLETASMAMVLRHDHCGRRQRRREHEEKGCDPAHAQNLYARPERHLNMALKLL